MARAGTDVFKRTEEIQTLHVQLSAPIKGAAKKKKAIYGAPERGKSALV